ncbi:DUF2306 domain-containing protein [Granulicella sp. dw_53]|uniref:DUF2306 domain-containing protein n=1 Tax=Granulicella sp. dw_53 TaxID=2719792 RepID=UPI001BD58A21|nr:DUF2306 domain-containing protein [Granulicella sp. dw_53]
MSNSLPRPGASRNLAKNLIWAFLGIAGIFVLIDTDVPLLYQPSAYRTKLIKDVVLLVPHIISGVLATALGPFLFSTRFRQQHFKRHRIMGRVYVISVAISAPTALILQHGGNPLLFFANGATAALWFLCTLAAFLAARNRQIQVHRQWMIRSYVFTLNFIFSRIPNPIPAFFNMSDEAFSVTLLFLSCCYLVLPDLYFNWSELTTSRKPPKN